MEPINNQEPTSFLQSSTAKLLLVGILTLVLLIPLAFVQNLITERSTRQKEVISETTQKWGEAIYLNGPILKIPYKQGDGKIYYAYFFPNTLNNITDVTMEKPLERSIYKSNVFATNFKFNGDFSKLDFTKTGIKNQDFIWNQAKIVIASANLKSLKDEISFQFNQQKLQFEPSNSDNKLGMLESNFFAFNPELSNIFKLNISFNGSKEVKIVPIGKTTTCQIQSNWHSPNFNGYFSPIYRSISNKGFEAKWKVFHFNKPFAQYYFNNLPNLENSAVSVNFIHPVDQYVQNDRASKYGFLVIGLTFLVFYLIQTLSKIQIHIFQYGMIGLSLIMFYTLLIAITEHSSFSLAYGISGVSVVGLIYFYSRSILKNIKFPLFILISLSVLYSFIYIIIQLEDYALLVGSIGLFSILAAIMYFSRNIDWNKN